MRRPLRRVLRKILKHLTKAVLAKHQPQIIALVGTSQTATVRETLYAVLHKHFPTRRNIGAPEAEFIIPLTIFGANFYPQTAGGWLQIITKTAAQLLFLKPHFHILILEMTTRLSEVLNYWLEITKPELVILCGPHPPFKFAQTTNLKPHKDLATKVGNIFGIPQKEILEAFSKPSLPSPRIKLLPGKNGSLVVDATYEYFPPPLKSLEEVLEPFSNNKIWIRSTKDWQKAEIKPKDVVVILGPRKDLLEAVEEAIISPLEPY